MSQKVLLVWRKWEFRGWIQKLKFLVKLVWTRRIYCCRFYRCFQRDSTVLSFKEMVTGWISKFYAEHKIHDLNFFKANFAFVLFFNQQISLDEQQISWIFATVKRFLSLQAWISSAYRNKIEETREIPNDRRRKTSLFFTKKTSNQHSLLREFVPQIFLSKFKNQSSLLKKCSFDSNKTDFCWLFADWSVLFLRLALRHTA